MRLRYSLLTALTIAVASGGAAWAQAPSPVEQASQARLEGRLDEARQILEAEVETAPGNADAWLQLGYVYTNEGDYSKARRAFETTLTIAPDYQDAELGLARLDWFEGRNESALQRLISLDDTDEVNALRSRIVSVPAEQGSPWRASLTAGYSELTEGLPAWTEVAAALSYADGSANSFTVLVDHAERFDLSDTYFEGRVDRRLAGQASGYVAVGTTPDAIFRPDWSLAAGLQTDIGGATALEPLRVSADVRHAEYPAGTVQSAKFGASQPFANDALRLGTSLILLSDEQGETRQGYVLQGEWQAAASSRLVLTYADAPETSDGQTLDVQSWVLGWRLRSGEKQSYQFNLLHESRQVYDRTGFVASTMVRF